MVPCGNGFLVVTQWVKSKKRGAPYAGAPSVNWLPLAVTLLDALGLRGIRMLSGVAGGDEVAGDRASVHSDFGCWFRAVHLIVGNI